MRLCLRETTYLDPVWAFRPEHVHWVLSLVIDYWGDEMGAYPFDLQGPLASKCLERAEILADARDQRLAALEPVREPIRLASDVAYNDASPGVTLLYASVLWEAVRDWADNCYSPFAVEQRRALQAYWWFMGLPYTAPTNMTEDGWASVARGRRRKYKVPLESTNPLGDVGLSVSALFVERGGDPELPPGFLEATPITLPMCCSALGISPSAVRRYIHMVRPD